MYSLENIKKTFENYDPKNMRKFKEVVVLIALINIDGNLNIIFEKRSDKVNQSGDISFIGGHIEDGEDSISAAIREAKEECNLMDENINIFGPSDYFTHFNSLYVHTYVCEIVGVEFKDIKPNYEVEKLIAVPLDEIMANPPKSYQTGITMERDKNFPYDLIQNGKNYKFFTGKDYTYFYEFNECVVWGLTAKILYNFIKIMNGEE